MTHYLIFPLNLSKYLFAMIVYTNVIKIENNIIDKPATMPQR